MIFTSVTRIIKLSQLQSTKCCSVSTKGRRRNETKIGPFKVCPCSKNREEDQTACYFQPFTQYSRDCNKIEDWQICRTGSKKEALDRVSEETKRSHRTQNHSFLVWNTGATSCKRWPRFFVMDDETYVFQNPSEISGDIHRKYLVLFSCRW